MIAAPGAASVAVPDREEHKKVLTLFSNDPHAASQVLVEQALRSTLQKDSPVPVEIYTEYLDDARTSAGGYEKEMVALLRRKYEGKKFDLIFAISDPSLHLLLRNRAELFTDIPIVFLTLDERNIAGLNIPPNVTGVWGEINFRANLELALATHRGTNRVVVIGGVSEWDKYWTDRAREDFRAYESSLEFTYLIGLTSAEQQQALATLPPRTIAIFVTSVQDNAGNAYDNMDLLNYISPGSTAPIYGTTDAQLGFGIVGGMLLSFEALGAEAARMGLRVMAVEKTLTPPAHGVPSVALFDWRELKRWGISETSLPAGSIVRFRVPSVWDEYKRQIITLVSLTVLQSVLIAGLLINRSRRKRAEVERERFASLAESGRRHLDEVISNLPGVVVEARLDPNTKELRTTFVSDYLQKMLGYTPDEWLNQPTGFELRNMPEEDRERVTRDSEAVLRSGKDGFTQFRWTTKNGGIVWVESYLSPILDQNGRVDGVRGVILDVSGRKHTEETLRETEEKNSAIVAAIPDLIFLQTSDGVYFDYHAKDPADLLLPPEEFLGKNMNDVLPQWLAAEFQKGFDQVSENHGPQILEYKLGLSNGDKWFEARIVRMGSNFLTVVRDITDRKVSEAALQKKQTELAGVIASAMDAIITVDESQQIVLFNAMAEMIFGCPGAQAVGQPFEQFIPPRFHEAYRRHILLLSRYGVTRRSIGWPEDFSALRASGEEFPIEASISQLELGGEKFYTIFLRDITRRKMAYEALRESEARFRNMADTAPVMIWISGTDKLYTYFNKQWLDFTGRAVEQELGNGWAEGIHPDDHSKCLETYAASFDERKPFRLEYRLRRADAAYRWIFDIGSPRFSPTGEFLGYIGSCVDITDRKEAERALHQANIELGKLKNQLEAENIYLQEELRQDQAFGDIIGQSAAIKYVLYKVGQVAPMDSTVLILGETGTGKELVARAIHGASLRKDRPLIKVNCAALSSTLIESELFGHEKGAFTGAAARKIGRFELANTGTLLLDEIGELPPDLQVKLLRVLQEGEFERVGSSKTIKVDVRIIASTNRELKLEVEKGRFREDLWYRLNVFPITTPPLRDRLEDIPILADHFARGFARKFRKQITGVSPNTMTELCRYSWPGNVRELANVIERAVINARGPVLEVPDDLSTMQAKALAASVKTLEEIERDYIMRVLEDLRWRIDGPRGAARVLGLNPSTLRTRMAKLGIHKPNARPSTAQAEAPNP